MNQELDYAEMLEIPVSTVKVVKKESIFKRKREKKDAQDELKEMVVDSVNERAGQYVFAEDLTEPQKPDKKAKKKAEKAAAMAQEYSEAYKAPASSRASRVIAIELVAVCVLAAAIFITNFLMPTSVINTFLGYFSAVEAPAEPSYNELKLSSVVGAFSDTDVNMTDSGVITFTAKGSVYPVCDGTVAKITEDNGLYTVQINHTSTFSSVITGLTDVYSAKSSAVKANIPFAYSNGENEVRVSMYNGEELLNCYTLSGEVPVWNP